MIYSTSQTLYCTLAEGKPTGSKRDKAICTAFPIFITVVYIAYPNPVFHQAAFAFLHFFIAYRVYFLLKRLPPKRRPTNGEKVNTLKRDAGRLLIEGIGLTVLAFAIWNLDNVFCDGITRWRKDERVPYWVGVLSQGHAWWHILSALGVNRSVTGLVGMCSILYSILTHSESVLKGVAIGVHDPDAYEYAYRLKLFPYVRPRGHHGTHMKAD
jgi:dihydroceramidase